MSMFSGRLEISSFFFFLKKKTSHCRALQNYCVGFVQAYLCALPGRKGPCRSVLFCVAAYVTLQKRGRSELRVSGIGIPCYLQPSANIFSMLRC